MTGKTYAQIVVKTYLNRLKLALKNRKGTLRVANLLKSAPKEDPSKMEEKPQISEEANNSLKSFRLTEIMLIS